MSDNLPLRDEEPTLALIRELRDAEAMDEALMARALAARRPDHLRLPDRSDEEPSWDDIQIITAQLARKPLTHDVAVGTELAIGRGVRTEPAILPGRLFVQFEPVGNAVLSRLTITASGLQVWSHDEGPHAALCIKLEALDRYRELMLSSERPCGVRITASQVQMGLARALSLGADFVWLDAADRAIRALADARAYLQTVAKPKGFAVILSGGLRTPDDFIKALALKADGVLVADSTIATIRKLAETEDSNEHMLVTNFLKNADQLMKVMTRACGVAHLRALELTDLTTWKHAVALASGVTYAGISAAESSDACHDQPR